MFPGLDPYYYADPAHPLTNIVEETAVDNLAHGLSEACEPAQGRGCVAAVYIYQYWQRYTPVAYVMSDSRENKQDTRTDAVAKGKQQANHISRTGNCRISTGTGTSHETPSGNNQQPHYHRISITPLLIPLSPNNNNNNNNNNTNTTSTSTVVTTTTITNIGTNNTTTTPHYPHRHQQQRQSQQTRQRHYDNINTTITTTTIKTTTTNTNITTPSPLYYHHLLCINTTIHPHLYPLPLSPVLLPLLPGSGVLSPRYTRSGHL